MRQFADLRLNENPDLIRVSNGEEALAVAAEERIFDMIITTIQPGDMNAGELARKVKEAGLDIPVVLLAFNHRELVEFLARDTRGDIWMVTDAELRIWLYAPIGRRIKRIVFRDQIADEKTAERITLEREECEAGRYHSYYNIDITDLSIYHLILNSAHWNVEGLGSIVDTAIMQLKSPEVV